MTFLRYAPIPARESGEKYHHAGFPTLIGDWSPILSRRVYLRLECDSMP
jgi:hypothetical protein